MSPRRAEAAEHGADVHTAILTVFGDYGFRKASMASLAEAAGVSRQTLYNRFDSKEAILAWAVNGLVEELRRRAVACLADSDVPASQALLDAFSHWLAPVVPLLRGTRHGAEILDLSADARRRTTADPLEGIRSPIRDFLVERGVRGAPRDAEDLSFALVVAGKGLLLTSRDTEELEQGMARVIAGTGIREAEAGGRRRRRPAKPARPKRQQGRASTRTRQPK